MPFDTREVFTQLEVSSLWRVEAVDDPSQPPVSDKLLDLQELAALLGTTQYGLKIRVSRARLARKPWPLPPVAPGWGDKYHYRFRERDVFEWIEKSAHEHSTLDTVFHIANRGLAYARDGGLPHAARGLLTYILAHDEDEMVCNLEDLQISESEGMLRQMLVELIGRGYIKKTVARVPGRKRGQVVFVVMGTPDPEEQVATMTRMVDEVLSSGELVLHGTVTQPRFVMEALGLDMDPRVPVVEDPTYAALRAGTLNRAAVLANLR